MLRAPGSPSTSSATEKTAPPSKSSRIWLFTKICLLVIVLLFAAEVGRIFIGSNFRHVIDGECYRCGQPTEDLLVELQRTHGIRTILNLRGENLDQPWYVEEKNAAERLGIKLINVSMSSSAQPPEHDFRKLVEGMDACELPVLIHCANGNDRSGLAATIYLMLYTETPMAEARSQLSIRYGHFPWGKAGCLQRLLDSYENWLLEKEYQHHADHFRYWAKNEYRKEQQ